MGIIKSISRNLLRIEIFIVAGAIGISIVFPRLLLYAVVVTALFWSFRWLGYGRLSNRTPNDWAVVILVVMAAVTTWATALPDTTRPQVYRLLLGIGFYYAIVNWTDTNLKLRLLVAGLSLTGLFLSIFGLFSVQWTTNKVPFMPDLIYQYIPTLISDLIHRNVLAGTLVLIIPIPIALLIYSWHEINHIEKIIFIISAITMLAILILTQSRAGWMAFGSSMAILGLMGGKWIRLMLLLGIIIGITVILFTGINPFLEEIIASNTIGGIEGRAEAWSRALFMIEDFPFTGVGMGSFIKVADTLYPFVFLWHGEVEHAHNLFLQVGVDLGIPGLISWLALAVIIFVTAWKLFRQANHSNNKLFAGLGAGFFCSQIALCTHGILDSVTWGMVRSAPIVWTIWGLVVVSDFLFFSSIQITQKLSPEKGNEKFNFKNRFS